MADAIIERIGPEDLGIVAQLYNQIWLEQEDSDDLANLILTDKNGKHTGYVGGKPGIRDEFERFVRRHPDGPVYLLGLLDGETRGLIEENSGEQPWQPKYLSSQEQELLRSAYLPDLAAGLVLADLTHVAKASCR